MGEPIFGDYELHWYKEGALYLHGKEELYCTKENVIDYAKKMEKDGFSVLVLRVKKKEIYP